MRPSLYFSIVLKWTLVTCKTILVLFNSLEIESCQSVISAKGHDRLEPSERMVVQGMIHGTFELDHLTSGI
jgi:hypothetical protein